MVMPQAVNLYYVSSILTLTVLGTWQSGRMHPITNRKRLIASGGSTPSVPDC